MLACKYNAWYRECHATNQPSIETVADTTMPIPVPHYLGGKTTKQQHVNHQHRVNAQNRSTSQNSIDIPSPMGDHTRQGDTGTPLTIADMVAPEVLHCSRTILYVQTYGQTITMQYFLVLSCNSLAITNPTAENHKATVGRKLSSDLSSQSPTSR